MPAVSYNAARWPRRSMHGVLALYESLPRYAYRMVVPVAANAILLANARVLQQYQRSLTFLSKQFMIDPCPSVETLLRRHTSFLKTIQLSLYTDR
jgi:hypothetical protein